MNQTKANPNKLFKIILYPEIKTDSRKETCIKRNGDLVPEMIEQ